MVKFTIIYFTLLLLNTHVENVKGVNSYPPKLRYCLDMIMKDFEWKAKDHLYLRKIISDNALKKKTLISMTDDKSRAYFLYLKNEIYIGCILDKSSVTHYKNVVSAPSNYPPDPKICECKKLETPNEFCLRITTRHLGAVNFHLYLVCVENMGRYFKSQGQGELTVLSDDLLEVAKHFYTYQTEDNLLLLNEKHYARVYYLTFIKHIKFNEEFLKPKNFCLEIGPAEEKLKMEERERKRFERTLASSSDQMYVNE